MRSRLSSYGHHVLPYRNAPSTRKGYSKAVTRWREFCDACGYMTSDWNDTTAYQFVCWRRIERVNMHNGNPCSAQTISGQLSGVRSWLTDTGNQPMPRNAGTMPQTSALLSAIRKFEVSKCKQPLTAVQLQRLCAHLPDTYDSVVLRWVLYLIHNTLRRISEVMPTMGGHMVCGDIRWSNGTWRPRLTPPYDKTASYAFFGSKTNQTGLMQTAFMWCRCRALFACALCCLRQLYRRCPWQLTPTTPLLLLVDGSIMTYSSTLAELKRLCLAAGLEPNDYATHSLRHGGVHDARDANHSDRLINMQGHWASNKSRSPYEKTRAAIDAQKLKEIGALPHPHDSLPSFATAPQDSSNGSNHFEHRDCDY